MFDANILYYSYNNTQGDDFGVGYLGNKDYWVHLLNTWNRNDGRTTHYHTQDFEELDCDYDLRGCQLAEIVPDDQEYMVFWTDDKGAEYEVRITHDNKIEWQNPEENQPSVPRWVNSLKKRLKDVE